MRHGLGQRGGGRRTEEQEPASGRQGTRGTEDRRPEERGQRPEDRVKGSEAEG